MGYSARYHALSLIAVFIALATGSVIGAVLGGDTLKETRRDLERSLTGNLEDARDRADELSGELGRSNEVGELTGAPALSTVVGERVYPRLVHDRLDGQRIGLVGLGNLPADVSDAVEEALDSTGARLVAVGVVPAPGDI